VTGGRAELHLHFSITNGVGRLLPGPTGPLSPFIRLNDATLSGIYDNSSGDLLLKGTATLGFFNLLGLASLKHVPATVTMDKTGITACTKATEGGERIGARYAFGSGFSIVRGAACG
jgi:hypothetical protein